MKHTSLSWQVVIYSENCLCSFGRGSESHVVMVASLQIVRYVQENGAVTLSLMTSGITTVKVIENQHMTLSIGI
jgi:hypothetical protein